jgi:hypothetical protein
MAGVIFGRGGSNQSAAYQPVGRIESPDFVNQAFPPRNGNIQGWNPPAPPNVAAAFSVDFTQTSTLPSQMTLSRASSGTYFNSSGVLSTATSNVARFDYDPWSLSPLGPLIEEQRTNYCQTGDLSAWSWAGTLYTVTAVAGLDGTNNAYNIVPSTASSSRTMDIHAVTVPATTANVIYSVYAKANGYGELIFREQGGQGNPGVSFNLFTGKVVGYENGWAPPATPPNTWFTDARIIPIGGGWYRCSVVCRYSSGTNTRWMGLIIGNGTWVPSNVSDPGPNYVFAGNGTSGVIAAYPQSEIATSASQVNPTSHIYTSGSAVTRSADIVSSTDATWLGYKGWVIETGDMQPDTDATLLGINTAIGIGYSSADVLTTADGGTQSTSLTLDPTYVHRGAIGWDSTPRVSISLDGSAVTTAANTPVTPTTLYFGNTNAGASGFLNGHIRMFGGYATLADADLPSVSVQGATFSPSVSSVGSAAGANTATGVGSWLQTGTGSSAGANTVTGVGSWLQTGTGSSTGANTATATGRWLQSGTGSSAGANTATATGAWLQTGTGSSTGTNTATATGAWLQTGTGSSAGTNTATATAAPIQTKVGSATGANTATGVGSWLQSGVGSATGANTATGIGSWLFSGVGASAGSNTATASGAWLQTGVGFSAGSNTASGVSTVGGGVVSGDGLAVGANIATAIGAWLQTATATAIGGNVANAIAGAIEADFSNDFAEDFSGYPGAEAGIGTGDFNNDFNDDFAVFHIGRIVTGVGLSVGGNIATAVSTTEIFIPPVYPPVVVPVKLWHPAQEYHRVQAPTANRLYRHGTELHRGQAPIATRIQKRGTELQRRPPQGMKRRYG